MISQARIGEACFIDITTIPQFTDNAAWPRYSTIEARSSKIVELKAATTVSKAGKTCV